MVKKHAIILILFALLFARCVKDDFDSTKLESKYDFKSGIGVPVGYKTFTAHDFFADLSIGKILVGDNGLLELRYATDFETPRAADIFSFKNISESQTIINNTTQVIQVNDLPTPLVITDSLWLQMELIPSSSATEMNRIIFDQFGFSIKTTSALNSNISFRMLIQDITVGGIAFERTISANSELVQQIAEPSEFTLHTHTDQKNAFLLIIETEISPSGFNESINPGSSVLDYEISLHNFSYRTIYGIFGNYAIPVPQDQLLLDLYTENTQGAFYFARPVLKIFSENSIGAPAGIGFISFESKTRHGGQQPFTGDDLPDTINPWIYNYPALVQSGQTVNDSLIIEREGWNFSEVSGFAPEDISIGAQLTLNPENIREQQFISNTSQTKFKFELILPLFGNAGNILVSDTIQFNLNDFITDDAEQVKRAFFRFYATNAFPVDFHFQAYITNEDFVIIDSLFTERPVINGALNEGINTVPNKNDPVITEISREQFDRYKNQGAYLISKAYFQTTGYDQVPPKNVGIYSHHFLDVQMGLVLDVEGSSDDFN